MNEYIRKELVMKSSHIISEKYDETLRKLAEYEYRERLDKL
jgi:hypothetical protein